MPPLTQILPAAAFLACLAGCLESRVTHPHSDPAPIPRVAEYPVARRADVTDTYHGTSVADPYRWLEDVDSPETREWVDAQWRTTEDFLSGIPVRAALRDRLTEIWKFEKFGVPAREGGRLFYTRNDGLQQQSVLWVEDRPGAMPRVLVDPNGMSRDGTVAIGGVAPSPDGRLVAWSVAEAGSDWNEWRIRDVDSGADLPDRLHWIKFSGAAWLADSSGFFYSRYAEPEPGQALKGALYHQKLWFHRVGTPQSQDTLVHERPDQKEWGFSSGVTDDGAWLTITIWRGTEPRNAFAVRDLATPDAPIVEILSDWDAQYALAGNAGSVFYFRTDLDAPLGRVVAIDVRNPAREHWRTVVPESGDTLEGVSLVGGRLVCRYLHHAHARVAVHELDGRLVSEVPLPGLGTVAGFGGRTDASESWFLFTGFTTPAELWRYDVATGKAELHRRPTVAFRPEDFVTDQVFATSRDGTRVPMFITRRRDVAADGTAPCVLYGYGGFDIPITPAFSPAAVVWMERGGVFVNACLRGGGEYGRTWHEAGTKLRKQNVFDDFVACAEHLVRERWTNPARLAISGGSNGGLLVGACMVQRPDLFAAAMPSVGVLDMLRYHRFTIGWAWASDYGTVEDEAEFRALLAYSPVHNLRRGTSYPATLICTGDHDDRVFPAHSFKFAAALQDAQSGTAPCLVRIEKRAGHGAGKPTSKIIEEAADRWAFLCAVLGVE